MEVKAGYKQTEVGVIPEEWVVKTLSEITTQIIDGTHFTPRYTTFGVPFLRVTDIQQSEIDFADLKFISPTEHSFLTRRCLPQKGDLLLSKNGTIGIPKVVTWDWEFSIFVSLALLKLRSELIGASFLEQFFRSDFLTQQIRQRSKQGTVTNLHLEEIREFNIPLPPTKVEQDAIATALSDVDGLLGGLDRLIAKKRDLKQAAMQQLLTGQTRLPGFHGGWEVKRLGDLFNFSGGYSASRDQLSTEGHCYLHYGDIHGSNKTCIDTDADFQNIPKLDIPLKRVSPASLLDDGDVVFVDASEDDAGTSKHVVVVNKSKKPFISGLHTIVAKSKTDELTHEFRRYCFQTPAIRQQFLFYSVGTKVSGISKSNIPKLTLSFPSVPEQTAIASVLSEMDGELTVLEQRREKTRALKQAMMQELLTGRTRLL
jgi:type I restriction enzyme S subunit